MDLLGRKVTIQNGEAVKLWMAMVAEDLEKARQHEELIPYCDRLDAALKEWVGVIAHLSQFAKEGDMERFLADANLFMEMSGIVMFGWQWIKMAAVARNMVQEGREQASFFAEKFRALKFHFHYEIPKIHGLVTRLKDPEMITIQREAESV